MFFGEIAHSRCGFKKNHQKIFPEPGDILVVSWANFGNFEENPPDFRDFPGKAAKNCPNHPKSGKIKNVV